MTEISTDVRGSRLNYISSSLCSTSAAENYSCSSSAIVYPGVRPLVIGPNPINPRFQENLLPAQVPRRLDSLSDEMSESYTRVLKENKDVLMLLAE